MYDMSLAKLINRSTSRVTIRPQTPWMLTSVQLNSILLMSTSKRGSIFCVEAHKRILLNHQDLRSCIHRHINPRPLLDLPDLNGVRQAAPLTGHHHEAKLLNSIIRTDLTISKLYPHRALNKFRHMNIE